MPDPTSLRRALAAHLGKTLTPDIAAEIFAAGDEFSLSQRAKGDEAVADRLMACLLSEQAVRLVLDIAEIAHVWDDLVDGDAPVPQEAVHRAFTLAIGLHRNELWTEHWRELMPVLDIGILNWHAANDLEADGRRESLQVAHVIRCQVGDVALKLCELLHGHEFARRHAARLRMLMQQDSLDEYLRDHEATE